MFYLDAGRDNMKKKYVLKNRKRFYSIISLLVFVTVLIVVSANVYSQRTEKYESVVVKKGDTVWSIAEKLNLRSDTRRVVSKIITLNNLTDCRIFEGTELLVPVDRK